MALSLCPCAPNHLGACSTVRQHLKHQFYTEANNRLTGHTIYNHSKVFQNFDMRLHHVDKYDRVDLQNEDL